MVVNSSLETRSRARLYLNRERVDENKVARTLVKDLDPLIIYTDQELEDDPLPILVTPLGSSLSGIARISYYTKLEKRARENDSG
jgi:hypothetical protein